MKNYPLLNKVLLAIQEKYPALASGVIGNHSELAPYAEQILSYYVCYATEEKLLSETIDHFARISFDFLRLQAKFLKTNQYENKSGDSLSETIYQNQEKMKGYYLNGLFITYALWPNHVKIYQYYIERFLDKSLYLLQPKFVEIGSGHGLMAATLLSSLPKVRYCGLDISPYSLEFTHHILQSMSIAPVKYQLEIANAMDENSSRNSNLSSFSAGICSEVLEHVEHPEKILSYFHRVLPKKARLFITTVINIAAEDHIYLFKTASEIRDLISNGHFSIESELILPLSGFPHGEHAPANYAAILIRN